MEQQNAVQKTIQNGADSFFLHLKQIRLLFSKLGAAHLSAWMIHHRKTYPGFIFRAGYVAVGFVFAALAMHMVSTGFGRIAEDIILQAGYAVGLIAFFALAGNMAVGTFKAAGYAWATWEDDKREAVEQIPLLIANKWQAPAVSPDVILARLRGETMADFTERVAAINPTSAIWYILIKPGEMAVTVFKPGKGLHFERGQEPFLDMVPENERPNIGGRALTETDHQNESREYYEKYVQWFSIYWPRYATRAKYEADPENAHKTAIDVLKASANILLLLLFCLPAFGQSKARQVDEALGTRIREIPKAGAMIRFSFQDGSKEKYYERRGDGVKDYTELLQKTSGIVPYNDEGGTLIAVTKNGEVIARGASVERVNTEPPKHIESPIGPNGKPYLETSTTGDPIRPRGTLQGPDVEKTPVTDEPLNIHIPTPDEVQTTLDNASREIDYRKTEAWAAIKPIWKWIMGMFFSIVPLFICLGGLFRYYAGTAANESFYGLSGIGILIRRVHETASGVTLLICWGIATILLIDEFMLFVYLGIPLWLMLATWFPSLFLAKVLTNWAVPNPPELAHGRGGYDQPYAGQRRIG